MDSRKPQIVSLANEGEKSNDVLNVSAMSDSSALDVQVLREMVCGSAESAAQETSDSSAAFVQKLHDMIFDSAEGAAQDLAKSPGHHGTMIEGAGKTGAFSGRDNVPSMAGTNGAGIGSEQYWKARREAQAGMNKRRSSEEDFIAEFGDGSESDILYEPRAKKIRRLQLSLDAQKKPFLEPDSVPNQTDELAMFILKHRSMCGYDRHLRAPGFFSRRGTLFECGWHILRMEDDQGELLIKHSELLGRGLFKEKNFNYVRMLRLSKGETYSKQGRILRPEQARTHNDQGTSSDTLKKLSGMKHSSALSSGSPGAALMDASLPMQRRHASADQGMRRMLAEVRVESIADAEKVREWSLGEGKTEADRSRDNIGQLRARNTALEHSKKTLEQRNTLLEGRVEALEQALAQIGDGVRSVLVQSLEQSEEYTHDADSEDCLRGH